MFKAVHGIHWQSLIVCKVYGFDNRSSSVGFVAQMLDEMIYFTVAGKFYGDFFAFAAFAVNLIGAVTDELIQKTDSGLRYVVAV